jgi:hypothetical protein
VIREAELHDMPRIIAMGRRFHADNGIAGTVSAEDFSDFIARIIQHEDAVAFVSDAGLIAGLRAPLPWDASTMGATKMLWWSWDGSGADLVRAFCEWARCSVEMSFRTGPRDAATLRLLQGLGFEQTEVGMQWASKQQ